MTLGTENCNNILLFVTCCNSNAPCRTSVITGKTKHPDNFKLLRFGKITLCNERKFILWVLAIPEFLYGSSTEIVLEFAPV